MTIKQENKLLFEGMTDQVYGDCTVERHVADTENYEGRYLHVDAAVLASAVMSRSYSPQ